MRVNPWNCIDLPFMYIVSSAIKIGIGQYIVDTLIQDLQALRDLFSHHPMFAAGVLLLVGYFIGKLVAKIKLPEITGYIIAGLLMGEAVTGIFPEHMGESFTIVTEVALGLIALTIGAEFSIRKLRHVGAGVLIITVVQLLATFVIVSIGLMLVGLPKPFALLLGAIASATAPAATVAIVQSLRAKGLFIDYLYGVVALDDAGCVILFGIVFAFASGVISAGTEAAGAMTLLLKSVSEVIFSLLIGVIEGALLHFATRRKNRPNEILILSLGLVFLTTAFAIVLHFSPLLTNMAAGAVVINLSARNRRIFQMLEPLTPPLYALFFVMAGAELQPGIVLRGGVLLIGSVYIVLRALGKYGGSWAGAVMCGAPASIRKYLGFSMLPQAGVAIGLVLLIQASPLMEGITPAQHELVMNMVNVVLLSVFVNELIGPPLSKFAVIRGNEMEE